MIDNLKRDGVPTALGITFAVAFIAIIVAFIRMPALAPYAAIMAAHFLFCLTLAFASDENVVAKRSPTE